jgi:DNA-binding HxlR family transcriptional regulator
MEKNKSHCPINLCLEVFGDKWSLLIIRDIMFGDKKYFREFLQSEEKIASNILTDRLTTLEREGIINKVNDPDHKLKFIYSLTKKGIDLLPIMVEIGAWGMKHGPYDEKKHAHAKKMVKGGKEMQKLIRKQLERKVAKGI